MALPVNSFEPIDSFAASFDRADLFAAAIPGGTFGALPLAGQAFDGGVRVTNLGNGVTIRGVSSHHAMVFRTEFAGYNPPSIVYILPALRGGTALLDGREVTHRSIASRVGGHTPLLRTFGPYEIGTIAVFRETLRQAAAIMLGRDFSASLLSPTTTLQANPLRMAQLSALHQEAGQLLAVFSPQQLATSALPGVQILRDRIVTTLVSTLDEFDLKSDHLARQLQTVSMAKIDRFIAENYHTPFGLQEMCSQTGLALRTIEAIVRSRTGLSPVVYLRCCRLASAHKALRWPNDRTTVTGVALDSGFLHFGRFSIHYREIYGESPRDTLRRSRGY